MRQISKLLKRSLHKFWSYFTHNYAPNDQAKLMKQISNIRITQKKGYLSSSDISNIKNP